MPLIFVALLAAFFANADARNPSDFRDREKIPLKLVFTNEVQKVDVFQPATGPCHRNVKILIIALSRAEDFRGRARIRSTWGTNFPEDVRLLFSIGLPDDTKNPDASSSGNRNTRQVLAGMSRESAKFGDLLISAVIDKYGKNVGVKLLSCFHWVVEYCPSALYIVKIDADDSVLNVAGLWYWIDRTFNAITAKTPGQRAIYGAMFKKGGMPFRQPDHKWYLPWTDYPPVTLPAYMNGPTYMISRECLAEIVRKIYEYNSMRLEDVWLTGVLAHLARCQRYDAGEHFRSFGKVYENERCSHSGRPLIVSLTMSDSKDVKRTYEILKSIKCSKHARLHKWAGQTNQTIYTHQTNHTNKTIAILN